jgi:hypothetical protein
MLDDLRRSALRNELEDLDEDEESLRMDDLEAKPQLFLGMTPVERMFISIFLFMNAFVLGLAFLLATHRIVF